MKEEKEPEELYLLEVLLDEVTIENDDSWTSEVPSLQLVGKIEFLGLPDLTVEPNELIKNPEKKDSCEGSLIGDLPNEDWSVEEAADLPDHPIFPQFRVRIKLKVEERKYLLSVLVPAAAVGAGEGLRYVYTALERKVSPEILSVVQEQIKEAMEKQQKVEEGNDGRGDKGAPEDGEVIEDIAGEEKPKPKPIKFSAGKSCLFQMPPSLLAESQSCQPLTVRLYRSGAVDSLPVHHLVGKSKVQLEEHMAKLIEESRRAEAFPVSCQMEDSFPMVDLQGKQTGRINLFVRLSSFGTCLLRPPGNCPGIRDTQQVGEEPDVPGDMENTEGEKRERRRRREALIVEERELLAGRTEVLKSAREEPYLRKVCWRRLCDEIPPHPPPHLLKIAGKVRKMPPKKEKEPPQDPMDKLKNLPRCSHWIRPPCYRLPGVRPLSSCEREAKEQLAMEANTKAIQTDRKKKKDPCAEEEEEKEV